MRASDGCKGVSRCVQACEKLRASDGWPAKEEAVKVRGPDSAEA